MIKNTSGNIIESRFIPYILFYTLTLLEQLLPTNQRDERLLFSNSRTPLPRRRHSHSRFYNLLRVRNVLGQDSLRTAMWRLSVRLRSSVILQTLPQRLPQHLLWHSSIYNSPTLRTACSMRRLRPFKVF